MIKKMFTFLKRLFIRKSTAHLVVTDVSNLEVDDKIHVIGTNGVIIEGKVKRIKNGKRS